MDPNDYTGPVSSLPDQSFYGSVGYNPQLRDDNVYANHIGSDVVQRDGGTYQRIGDPNASIYAPFKNSITSDKEYGNLLPMDLQKYVSDSRGVGKGNFAEALMAFAGTVGAPILGSYFLGGAGGGIGEAAGEAAGATGGGAGGSVFGGNASEFLQSLSAPQYGMSIPGISTPTGLVDYGALSGAAGAGASNFDSPYDTGDNLINNPEMFGPQTGTPQSQMDASDTGDYTSRNANTALNGQRPDFLQQLAQRFLPGGTGGGPLDIIKQLAGSALKSGGGGSGDNGSGWLGPLLSIGSGLYGLSESDKLKKLAAQSGQQADPFGPYRAGFGQQLQDLWQNPGNVTKLPGYQAGEQAVQRSMAAQGYQGSGNMATALQKYGGDFFNNATTQLAGLSGAGFNPAAGASLNLQGNQGAIDLASRSLASIGYGARGQDTFSQLLSRLAL